MKQKVATYLQLKTTLSPLNYPHWLVNGDHLVSFAYKPTLVEDQFSRRAKLISNAKLKVVTKPNGVKETICQCSSYLVKAFSQKETPQIFHSEAQSDQIRNWGKSIENSEQMRRKHRVAVLILQNNLRAIVWL